MTEAIAYEIRSGAYYDSIVLMQLQRALAGLGGVRDAGVVMATRANLELLAEALPEQYRPLYAISAVTGEGVKNLVQRIGAMLEEAAAGARKDEAEGL